MDKKQFSFLKGWGRVPQKKAPEVKKEIMAALKIKTRVSWGQRLRGDIEPRVSEAKAIEEVFAKHGIAKHEVWGE